MARALFQRTEAQPDINGFLLALAAIEIGVYVGGSYGTTGQALESIYQARTGTAEGPAPEASASGGPNPFVTGSSGASEFWLDAGFYDVHIRDTQVPPRIPERTIQHMSVPGVAGGIPGSWLGKPSGDSGIDIQALSDAVLRQVAPLGQVIEWWRPADTILIPSGWEPCDGRSIAGTNHDFPLATAITLPDLRNKFILGADPNKSDGVGASIADGPSNAPGIRGSGGSQTHVLTAAESGVNGNGGTGSAGAHAHTFQGESLSQGGAGVVPYFQRNVAVDSTFWGTDTQGAHVHPFVARNADSAHVNVPSYVGLMKLMKVRRA